MKIVMPCAAAKVENAGFLMWEDRRVMFVADPALSPSREDIIYARPDDVSPNGKTWRQLLIEHNDDGGNRFKFAPAFALYSNSLYRKLADTYGVANLFILSAGWGLVSADFLLPRYDITFKKLKGPDVHKVRKAGDVYQDFQHVPDANDEVVFIGVKDYVTFFDSLTHGRGLRRTTPRIADCKLLRYPTRSRTNWQYQCAADLIRGDFQM